MKKYGVMGVFILFAAASRLFDFPSGEVIGSNFLSFFIEMLKVFPFLFILIGLADVWLPKEKVEKHIGKDSGVMGTIWVILLAMLQAGPLYGAFPVAYILWKKGSGVKNIFIFLGAFPMMKLPLLSFEVAYLGLKFTLIRTAVTVPVFILIAVIMDRYLKNRNFTINPQENKK